MRKHILTFTANESRPARFTFTFIAAVKFGIKSPLASILSQVYFDFRIDEYWVGKILAIAGDCHHKITTSNRHVYRNIRTLGVSRTGRRNTRQSPTSPHHNRTSIQGPQTRTGGQRNSIAELPRTQARTQQHRQIRPMKFRDHHRIHIAASTAENNIVTADHDTWHARANQRKTQTF